MASSPSNTKKFGKLEVYVEDVDLENSGQLTTVYGTNCAQDFWDLMSLKDSRFEDVHYLWVPPDLKQNADQSTRKLFAWRGDTRQPDEIFGHGFSRRGTSPPTPAIIYRKRAQDIAHYTAVCLSGTHEIAALFPPKVPNLPMPATNTWVYCVRLRGYWCPTYAIQGGVAGSAGTIKSDHIKMAEQNLYARELAVLNVSNKDVIGAIEVRRCWAGEGYDEGGCFSYIQLKLNPAISSDNAPLAARLQKWWTTKNLANTCQPLPKPA